ncbi:MAG: acyl carrier protein [Halobacteriales archaeon]|nr:acyl carrier protein [Halobacteriales archaeon]
MSSSENIDETVEEIIADRLRVDRSEFDDETSFTGETLDADSLDVVEAAEAIDANLGVHIPDEDLEELETVGDLKTYIRDHS